MDMVTSLLTAAIPRTLLFWLRAVETSITG